MSWSDIFGGIKKVASFALPVAGAALAGPVGGIVGAGLRKVVGGGDDSSTPAGGGGLDLGGIVGSGANWLAHNPNVLLAGGAAVSGIQKQNQADAYRKQALDAATGSYNERAPVRTAALANLSDNSTPDLSADFASSNPFQRKLRRVT